MDEPTIGIGESHGESDTQVPDESPTHSISDVISTEAIVDDTPFSEEMDVEVATIADFLDEIEEDNSNSTAVSPPEYSSLDEDRAAEGNAEALNSTELEMDVSEDEPNVDTEGRTADVSNESAMAEISVPCPDHTSSHNHLGQNTEQTVVESNNLRTTDIEYPEPQANPVATAIYHGSHRQPSAFNPRLMAVGAAIFTGVLLLGGAIAFSQKQQPQPNLHWSCRVAPEPKF
ncbi:MAG: hypothetical protein F6K16_43170 [Symploca sp. SIO2B6]|nr:hypothetical protein [Symploca sp. SIO2B6]